MIKHIKLKEFAEMAGVHPDTAIKWLNSPDCSVRHYKKNNRYYVNGDDAMSFLSDDTAELAENPIAYAIQRFMTEREDITDHEKQLLVRARNCNDTEELFQIAKAYSETIMPKHAHLGVRHPKLLDEAVAAVLGANCDE